MLKKWIISSLFVVFTITTYASGDNPTTISSTYDDPYLKLTNSMLSYAKKFRGTRYKSGGTGKGGFDCSGFVRFVYAKFGMDIAHSSRDLAKTGYVVAPTEAMAGDLIFFRRSSNPKSEVSHVGIVVEVNKNQVKFIHSATNGGVRYDYLHDAYYHKHFVSIRRVVDKLKNF